MDATQGSAEKIVRKKQDALVLEVLDRTIRTDFNEA